VDLQKRIVRHRKTIDATLDHGLSNGLIESTYIQIGVLIRRAFGFTKTGSTCSPGYVRLRRLLPISTRRQPRK
jgi:hypothetical protein